MKIMNMKKTIILTILAIFVVGMIIGAADAAHTIKYGKYKVKISDKEYKKLNQYKTKYKTVTKTRTVEKTKTNNSPLCLILLSIPLIILKIYSNLSLILHF